MVRAIAPFRTRSLGVVAGYLGGLAKVCAWTSWGARVPGWSPPTRDRHAGANSLAEIWKFGEMRMVQLWRSRKKLKDESSIAKIGVDTAEMGIRKFGKHVEADRTSTLAILEGTSAS